MLPPASPLGDLFTSVAGSFQELGGQIRLEIWAVPELVQVPTPPDTENCVGGSSALHDLVDNPRVLPVAPTVPTVNTRARSGGLCRATESQWSQEKQGRSTHRPYGDWTASANWKAAACGSTPLCHRTSLNRGIRKREVSLLRARSSGRGRPIVNEAETVSCLRREHAPIFQPALRLATSRRCQDETRSATPGRRKVRRSSPTGSTGQLVEHPLVKMLRDHDLLVDRLGAAVRMRHRGPEPLAVFKLSIGKSPAAKLRAVT